MKSLSYKLKTTKPKPEKLSSYEKIEPSYEERGIAGS